MATNGPRRRRRRIAWEDLDPIGIGNELRRSREALGLSIDEVAEATRVRSSYLAALEDEAFALLPGSVAGRGLLKTYAVFLGLDAIELLSALEARGRLALAPAAIEREAKRPPLIRPLAPRVLGLVVALVCVFGLTYFVYSQYAAYVATNRNGASPRPDASLAVGSVATPTSLLTPTATSQPTGTPLVGAPALLAATPTARALPPTATPAPPTPTPLPTSTPPPSPTSQLEIVVEARISADTAARVEIDGALFFEGFLNAPDQRTWRGSTITLQAANAGAIEITLNGRPIGKLGTAGQAKTVTWSR
jgi:cytoskeleton protein RodZ